MKMGWLIPRVVLSYCKNYEIIVSGWEKIFPSNFVLNIRLQPYWPFIIIIFLFLSQASQTTQNNFQLESETQGLL